MLFGAGQTGDYFFEILKQYGINIKCYIDNYKSKQNTLRNGIMVYSFVEAIEKYQDPIICITSVYEEEIYAQIGQYSKLTVL